MKPGFLKKRSPKAKKPEAPPTYMQQIQPYVGLGMGYAIEYRSVLMFTATVAYIFFRGDDLSV